MACFCGQQSGTNGINLLPNFKFTVFSFYLCDKEILKIGCLMYDLTVSWEKIKKSICLPPEWGGR